MVGVVIAAYAIPQMLLRIPIGLLFDVTSHRKLLLFGGIVTTGIGALGLGLAPTPWLLFLSRAITGIGAAAWVAFTVYFTAYYPREGARRAIGIINFVQGSAVVVATLAGGLVAEWWGSGYTFWGAALLAGLALFALVSARSPASFPAEPIPQQSFIFVVTRVPLLTASLMGILAQFANWAGLFSFVPVYADQIGASNADLGFITTLSLASAAGAALLVVPIAPRYGHAFTIVIGSVLLGGTQLIVPLVHSIPLLELIMIGNGLGRGILNTILMVQSLQAVAPQQRATAMGVYQATYAVGTLLGPLVSGMVADSLGIAAVFHLSASLCLVIAVIAYLPRWLNRR
jgi:MFS family permease